MLSECDYLKSYSPNKTLQMKLINYLAMDIKSHIKREEKWGRI